MGQLRVTLLAGLILLVIAGGILTTIYLLERRAGATTRAQDTFNRLLRDFDSDFNDLIFTEREMDRLNGELDRLEDLAIGVESWLSIIKRRRALAAIHSPSWQQYRLTVDKARAAYPSSQPIIAIAAAALVRHSSIGREHEERLREWLPSLTDQSFNTLRLALHVILGDFRSPQAAAAALSADIYSDGTEAVDVNLALLKTLRGDYSAAAGDIQLMLARPSASQEVLRFAAEFHYDFGDLHRSAEIFSQINDEYSISRQADALFLAGYTDMAAAIWSILADSSNENSLYNLAVITEDEIQSAQYLEKLVNLETPSNSSSRQAGLIRYSRTLPYTQSLDLLRNTFNFSVQDFPYIDLEICKRLADGQNFGLQTAQTWLLLDRHENEEVYKWATWLFFHMRNFNEAGILIERLNRYKNNPEIIWANALWIDIYRAIYLLTQGNINRAEDLLLSILRENSNLQNDLWAVYANLGRVMETFRSYEQAQRFYEQAAASFERKANNARTAARIQIRIARCLSAQNRHGEARLSLLYALELDPGNLSAQMELERLF